MAQKRERIKDLTTYFIGEQSAESTVSTLNEYLTVRFNYCALLVPSIQSLNGTFTN